MLKVPLVRVFVSVVYVIVPTSPATPQQHCAPAGLTAFGSTAHTKYGEV